MIQKIASSSFKQMPWKNGGGSTTQIYIDPATASLEKNNFTYRLSSAPVEKDGEFSIFPGKSRILTTIKGKGFSLDGQIYEKFEVAQFTGEQKVYCNLLKGAILDFGIIYDPQKVMACAKILKLTNEIGFSIDPKAEHLFTLLEGDLFYNNQVLMPLETIHFKDEAECHLMVGKSAVLFYLTLSRSNIHA